MKLRFLTLSAGSDLLRRCESNSSVEWGHIATLSEFLDTPWEHKPQTIFMDTRGVSAEHLQRELRRKG